MSEPTSSLSFYDLILRVAEAAGMAYYGSDGQGSACVPIDKYNFDKCKRIVNDGIRLFISRAPENGWKWRKRLASITFPEWTSGTATGGTGQTLVDTTRTEAEHYFNTWILYIVSGTGAGETATVTNFTATTFNLDGTVNVGATFTFSALSGTSTPDTTSVYKVFDSISAIINYDVSKYLMPEDFGGEVTGQINYAQETNHGTIEWTTYEKIRKSREDNLDTGDPDCAAYFPYQPTSQVLGSSRRWGLIVDPEPDRVATVEFPYIAAFDDMRMASGIATAGSSTSLTDTTRTEADNHFNGWILTIIAGTGVGESFTITDYVKSTGVFTFVAGVSTPTTTSAYIVQPSANLHPAGFMFDEVIRCACMAELERQIADVIDGALEYFMKVAIPDAHRIDKGSAPRTVGNMNGRIVRTRNWNDVTYNGSL
jgi:hypothetical protein